MFHWHNHVVKYVLNGEKLKGVGDNSNLDAFLHKSLKINKHVER